jgi:hypothetical protein
MPRIEKTFAAGVAREMEAAVRPILDKYGLSGQARWTYGDYFEFKMKATKFEEGANGVNLNSPEAQMYLLNAKYDPKLSEDAVGRKFRSGGQDFVFLGMNPRAKRYLYLAKRERDGAILKFTDSIEHHLA